MVSTASICLVLCLAALPTSSSGLLLKDSMVLFDIFSERTCTNPSKCDCGRVSGSYEIADLGLEACKTRCLGISDCNFISCPCPGGDCSTYLCDCWIHETCDTTRTPGFEVVLYAKQAISTPAPAGASGASAVGDPHLQNVYGQRFDLMKVGKHVLINIPRGKDADHALLRVQADARRLGENCADMYFQEVNVTGSWAEAQKAGGYHYSVSQNYVDVPKWTAFGNVELKVVHGRTDRGLLYLNVYVKHLLRAGFAIGGLLGEDDHQDVTTPPEECIREVSLFEGGRQSVASLAVASLD